ncbi:MAG TPA: aminotransferase class V-fold PLP-dependent enzyme [Acetobacteraceae bacterium]|jgi:glutamate/tyrosine decarboxylase-like PLP-dependent enzyme
MATSSLTQALFAQAAQHAAEYRRTVGAAAPPLSYAAMRAAFDAPTPEHGMPAAEVIEDLVARSAPGLRAMTGPRFFGWVIGASHPVGVAADWLTAAWGQNAGNHEASPAAAAAETVAAKWLLDLLDLPRDASVGFVTGATIASFVCLAAARGAVLRRVGWNVEADGLFGAPPIYVLIGDDAHTSVFSALQFLGLGHDRVVRIATDAQGRMLNADVAQAIAACAGPAIIVAQAGQLNTGAFDPISEIVPLARQCGAWVHVDGAFGLWARACQAKAHLAAGFEAADSWATDGHKWLQTPYDCGYAIVRDAEAHRSAMTIAASYLPPVAEGERDPSHFVPELSRRARGFATWATIRHLGRDGIAAMVAEHCRLAALMAVRLAHEPDVFVLNDVVLNQVIVRFGARDADAAADRVTLETIQRVQADGTCFAGGARWRDRWVMRLSVISAPTAEADIERTCDAICAAWRSVRGSNAGR